jgi:polysaccharide biosynthesis transport protein
MVITTYKQRHMGELPEQQEANQRALDRLQLQLQSHREALDNAQNRKSLLLRQLSTQEPEGIPEASAEPEAVNPTEQQLIQQIIQRRQALQEMRRLHTDKYPDIPQLQRHLAELEAQLAAYRAGQPTPKRRNQALKPVTNALRKRMQEEILQTELDITKLQRQQLNVQEHIALYEKKVTHAAQREQELTVLTRDYESTRKNYESLLARQMQAKMAENLERRQKAEQFRVLDPARVPSKPWEPQRAFILLMGLGLGIAVGGGGVFLAEYLDQSFRDPEDLENFTALPVLATIPFLTTQGEQPQERRKQKFLYAACMLLPVVTLTAVHIFGFKLDLLLVRTLQLLHP